MAAPRPYRRLINVDFYQVQCGPRKDTDLGSAVDERLRELAEIPSRNFVVKGEYHRVDEWIHHKQSSSGVLLRLRKDSNAKIGSFGTAGLRDVDLKEGETLVDWSCFAYFPEFRVLAVHRNRDVGGVTRLASYFEELTNVRPIVFSILLTKSGLQQLASMKELTTAQIKLAIPPDLKEIEPQNATVKQMIALAKSMGAASIEIRLSMEHTKKPLGAPVFEFIGSALKGLGSNLKSAKITGNIDSDTQDFVATDLVREQMREVAEVEVRASAPEIISALRDAYSKRRNDIQLLYTSKIISHQGHH